MLVMFFELLAAPPCSVGIDMKFCKLFTGRIIKMFGVEYFQLIKAKIVIFISTSNLLDEK